MLSRSITRSLVLVPLCLGLAAACGDSAPPPVAPPPPPPPAAVAPKLHMSAELGEIDEAATIKTFDRLGPTLMRCYTSGLERIEYMAGDVKFYIRVKPDGRLRW